MTTYLRPEASPIALEDRPLLASWDRDAHPSQVRLRAYLQRLLALVEPAIAELHGPMAFELNVGLGNEVDLLYQRDLDNYLQPIANMLPPSVCSYWASKSTATSSTVVVGPAVAATARESDGWRSAHGASTAPPGGPAWKEAVNAAIAATATLAPDGPLELQVTFAVGEGRNWRTLWKPAIDALDPILGRTRPDRKFHPRDDRIVSIGLHRTIDRSLGAAASIDVHWRSVTGIDVGKRRFSVKAVRSVSSPEPLPRTDGRVASHAITFFVGDDEGYESWLDKQATGYVVNATRKPKPKYLKLHRASCRFISGSVFRRSGWTSGLYIKICADTRDALDGWALREVGGLPDASCSCHRA